MSLDGTGTVWADTPDSAALTILPRDPHVSMDVVALIDPATWPPGSTGQVLDKTGEYGLYVRNNSTAWGRLTYVHDAGTQTISSVFSKASLGFTQPFWMRARYYHPDPFTSIQAIMYTCSEADFDPLAPTSGPFSRASGSGDNTAQDAPDLGDTPLVIGRLAGSSDPFTGDIHRIVIYEGIIGSSPTRIFDVDFVNGEYTAADKVLDSAGGAVVTIHGLT